MTQDTGDLVLREGGARAGLVRPTMLDGVTIFHDPLIVIAGGGIAPESEWPGRWVDHTDVVRAAQNGFGRDWFHFWHRYDRWSEVWGEGGVYDVARSKMKPADFFQVFDWNQRLIFGDYGSGKSTRFVAIANHWAQRGICTFHNGPLLGGRIVEGDEIFTLMQYMPKCSVLGHDEAHGTAPGRLAASTAVSVLRGLGANIRKLNVDWSLIGAQWKDVHPMVLEECVEAMELKRVPVEMDGDLQRLDPWNNPGNFMLHWDLWLEYPYKRMRERQRQRRRDRDRDDDGEEEVGFGAPDFWGEMGVEEARWAFVLTDSFRLVELTAITAKRQSVKDRLLGIRKESLETNRDRCESAVLEFALMLQAYISTPEGQNLQWVTPGDIEEFSGFDSSLIGRAVASFGVRKVRDKGYLVDDLIKRVLSATRIDEHVC